MTSPRGIGVARSGVFRRFFWSNIPKGEWVRRIDYENKIPQFQRSLTYFHGKNFLELRGSGEEQEMRLKTATEIQSM